MQQNKIILILLLVSVKLMVRVSFEMLCCADEEAAFHDIKSTLSWKNSRNFIPNVKLRREQKSTRKKILKGAIYVSF